MRKIEKKKLGDLLCDTGLISKDQLEWGLQEQKRSGKHIEEVLFSKKILTEKEILGALEFQLGIPQIDLESYTIDYNAAALVPESIAKRYKVIAIGIEGNRLKVAMKDPLDMFALDDLKLTTKMEISAMLASGKEIEEHIGQIYTSAKTKNIVDKVEKQMHQDILKKVEKEVEERADTAPMIQLVDNIIQRAILEGASDLHIEPFEYYVRIRDRVDGQLHEMATVKKETLNAITTRIKILSNMDIAERRLPQDGRMSMHINGQQVDLRISILPTIFGEKTVIRFIYRTAGSLELEDLCFHPQDYDKIRNLLKNPHGIILVTGPTGSGKSTTLAAALRLLNKSHVNIITVEDPVENMIDGINQIAVNTRIGLTFAVCLRSLLRQDPDIIMVGEMRDAETSSIAIRAAITGHLVLSTLHTNDAASSIARLIDMGTEPYMVGAALKGIISQRLVRKLCSNCKLKHSVTAIEQTIYKVQAGTEVYKAKGCSACSQTGYKGRMAVHEVLVLDSYLQDVVSTGKLTLDEIKEAAVKRSMRTLWDNAYYNVLKGRTTMEEMLRVTYEQ